MIGVGCIAEYPTLHDYEVLFKILAIDEPGGNRNLKININAQAAVNIPCGLWEETRVPA
jgi:hypothetical protein